MTTTLGVDIGGANLKYATADGRSFQRTFAMWKRPHDLATQLVADIESLSSIDRLAVTMTGELADCFGSRRQGVAQIVDEVSKCSRVLGIHDTSFYGTDGTFYDAQNAKQNWRRVAASNWHAIATWVAANYPDNALLIDIGSTTTDVIAIRNGIILTEALTDFERLRDQSLVYVGCRRTPVCGLVSQLRLRQEWIPVMNEVFATIDDARLVLGNQPEDAGDCETADCRPRDAEHAKVRLARMIGLDHDELDVLEISDLATQVHDAAAQQVHTAVSRWINRLKTEASDPIAFILSGHGQELLLASAEFAFSPQDTCIDLRNALPKGISRVAPAWAVVQLLQ